MVSDFQPKSVVLGGGDFWVPEDPQNRNLAMGHPNFNHPCPNPAKPWGLWGVFNMDVGRALIFVKHLEIEPFANQSDLITRA